MVVIIQYTRKSRLTEDESKHHMYKNKKVLADVINFILGKNGGHRSSSLGDRLIVVVNE